MKQTSKYRLKTKHLLVTVNGVKTKYGIHDDEQVAVSIHAVSIHLLQFINFSIDEPAKMLNIFRLCKFQPDTVDLK